MNFCSHCGQAVDLRVPDGDNRPRYVCQSCETIHYQNPNIVAGSLPVADGRILLCRRAIEPQVGKWTLPAGFMENGESVQEAAVRETREEANADISIRQLYALTSLPHISQVYMLFLASLQKLNFSPGTESLEVSLFEADQIPWDELAFPVISNTLQCYVRDLKSTGEFGLHCGEIIKQKDGSSCYFASEASKPD